MVDRTRPARSRQRATASGVTRTFSTRSDLVSYLHATGAVDDPAAFDDALDPRWADIFQAWVQQGATGCRFAQHRARHADAAQWLSIVVPVPLTTDVVNELQRILESAADAQAVQLLFPTAKTIESLASIVACLARHPGWAFLEIEHDPPAEDDTSVLIGLRWNVPNSVYKSEVLAFGPFDDQPFTRQAPVTTLTLRTHPPAKLDPDGRVHLAQMPLFEREAGAQKDYFWRSSGERKRDLLNGELLHSARARVSCRLPRHLWASALE